jgi:predicted nucleic acid-binding protein
LSDFAPVTASAATSCTSVRFVDTNVLLATRRRFGISYWDAAILEAGRSLGCDVVLSEDLSDGQHYDGVRVENPFVEAGD